MRHSESIRISAVSITPTPSVCLTLDRFQVVDVMLRDSDLADVTDNPDGSNDDDTPGTTIVDVPFNEGNGDDDVTVTVTDPETGDETEVSHPTEPNGPDNVNSTLDVGDGSDSGGATSIDDGGVTFDDLDIDTGDDVTVGFHAHVGDTSGTANETRTDIVTVGVTDENGDNHDVSVRRRCRLGLVIIALSTNFSSDTRKISIDTDDFRCLCVFCRSTFKTAAFSWKIRTIPTTTRIRSTYRMTTRGCTSA